MAIHTDAGPVPKPGGKPVPRWSPSWPSVTDWHKPTLFPESNFMDVLRSRSSRAGGRISEDDLAILLYHSTFLRQRRDDGRFGSWESRTAPGAGGLHGIHILCLPMGTNDSAGIYGEEKHALLAADNLSLARELNARSVAEIAGATAGTTLQFIADFERYDACYEAAESLIWRDSGVLTGVVSLVGAALGLVSIPLGRHGNRIVASLNLGSRFVAVGGIHLGMPGGRTR